jgi:hypothetical protein
MKGSFIHEDKSYRAISFSEISLPEVCSPAKDMTLTRTKERATHKNIIRFNIAIYIS